MAQISVIVAVYKMPEYLPRCIEGILNQSFSDLELILVDDGSPDNCGQICDEYAARDPRVHVIHKENAGVCVARNTGLDWVFANSDSSWIFFHDNDDWIHRQTLERLHQAAVSQGTKIAVCGYQQTTGPDPELSPEELAPVLVSPRDFYLRSFVNATVCWGKLYARECFSGKRYPPGMYIEDEFLTYKLLFAQKTLSVIKAPLYAYYVNPAGITKRGWSPKRLDAWLAYEEQIAYFTQMEDRELVSFRYRGYLENALANLDWAARSNDQGQYDCQLRQIRRKIRQLLARMWRKGFLNFRLDFQLLLEYYPLLTRGYRLYLEKIKK